MSDFAPRTLARSIVVLLAVTLLVGTRTVHSFSGGVGVEEGAINVAVDPVTGSFVDELGRVRIFHGVNVVEKKAGWAPTVGKFDAENSLGPEDVKLLQTWGMNAVRLGVMWPGVEPSMGQYNETYLTHMADIAKSLSEAGIYTIVDLHQDIMSGLYCGEGVPDFLVKAIGPLKTECSGILPWVEKLIGVCKSFKDMKLKTDPKTGYPLTSECLKTPFQNYYQTMEVSDLYSKFYTSSAVLERFEGYWKQVARTFADIPGVLGFDLFNEPWPGNIWDDPDLLKAGEADRRYLAPLYGRLSAVVRSNAPKKIVFYESVQFPDTFPILGGLVNPIGFEVNPVAGNNTQEYSALSYHIYCCASGANACDKLGNPSAGETKTCDAYDGGKVRQRVKDARRLKSGSFLTEFGACDGKSDTCLEELTRVADLADAEIQSWAYWQYKFYNDITTQSGVAEGMFETNGQVDQSKLTALSRAYAPKIAGQPLVMRYGTVGGAFRLAFTPRPIGGDTEIFIPTAAGAHATSGTRVNLFPQDAGLTAKMVTPSRLVVTAPGSVEQVVDVVVVPATVGPQANGTFVLKGGEGALAWSISEASEGEVSVEFGTNTNLTWWKGVKMFGDDGQELCMMQMQDGVHGPMGCAAGSLYSSALFSYRLELWKAKALGVHEHVDTIPFKYFGPLSGVSLKMTWIWD